jgi:NADH-quinone oxidoreductase subunit G
MADAQMVNLTIEGRPVSVPAGTSILEAAKVAGVLVPHYCYHPGLPVAGVCRMCLVEVEKAPKLAPSCATAVAEGQVVHVHSEKSVEARKGVLEMLLINHPLDCPICDQAGECELQDYTYQEGRAEGRYRDPKRFNPVEDFGGDVMYTPNRCILCTRCVRFMDDVAHDPVLNVSERGDRAVIGKFEGRDMTHPWAGNVIDLCPVGALLSKDSLNKARAWELDRTASVCPNCSQGCNMIVETRDNMVVRLRPRPNDDVNKYFMCDHGRLNYRWINRQDRIDVPLVRRQEGLGSIDWQIAIGEAADLLRGKRAFVLA